MHDSLPLLQLAGFDGQPVLRMLVAWLPAGAVAGLALIRVPRVWRAALALAVVLLLFASQAAFALTRNLRLADVLWTRHPGFGPWLEGVLFAAGCALPGGAGRAPLAADVASTAVGLIRDLRLRRSQHRDASEH